MNRLYKIFFHFVIMASMATVLSAISILSFAATNELDVILVMDSSGSMKKTDPQGLRKPAAKLFISLLGKTDRASVVSFSDQGYPVAFLTNVKGAENQQKLFAAVDRISTLGSLTNLSGAIEGAMRVIKRAGPTGHKQIIVLMSDGKIDLGDDAKTKEATQHLRDKLLPQLDAQQIEIHTIAFTKNSDKQLLKEIAEKTGGEFSLALSNTELHDVYTAIFERNKQPDMIPFDGEKFNIDSTVQEVTIVGSKDSADVALSLRSPSGKILKASDQKPYINWFVSRQFDLITISKPEKGQWRIKASSGKNKAYVITDLKLSVTANPHNPSIGEGIMIKAMLEEMGVPITKESIISSTQMTLKVHTPDNQTHVLEMTPESKPSEEADPSGIFTSHIALPGSGKHRLEVIAKAKTFSRERRLQIEVMLPISKAALKKEPVKETTQTTVLATNKKTAVESTKVKIPESKQPLEPVAKSTKTVPIDTVKPIIKDEKKEETHKELKKDSKKAPEKNAADDPTESTKKPTSGLTKAIVVFVAINLILMLIGGGIYLFLRYRRKKAMAANDKDGAVEQDADDPISDKEAA